MKKILLFLTFCLVITPPVLAARTTPAASDPDINMRLRGWGPATNITLPTSDPKTVLIDPGGPTDPLAPQLSTLLSGTLNTNPTILNLFQVNYTDGITPITTDGSSNWGVTLMEIDTGGLPVVVPKSGQTISSEGFKVLVLYASATDVTLQYTLEDGVACNGYTLHLVDFNVNPELVKLYEQNEGAGRIDALALPCGFLLGTGSSVKVAIVDTGTFIDPRVRKDWWHDPADNSCSSVSPKPITTISSSQCLAPSPVPTKPGPLESEFYPLKYKCDETTGFNPEYHPLRPYPGSPCDPLIPRSIPEAPQDPNLKYNTFACGTSLTPSTVERFDAYGQNGYYENLDFGYGYAHTICDPVPDDSPNGTTANCWRSEVFDITVDLSHANLGILGSTQDPSLTDEQKVNEYLSWYLTGTPQIGDQTPVNSNSTAQIDRLVNFSGPLRKLLPYDLTNTARKTVISTVGDDVHNYATGCFQVVSTNPTDWWDLIKKALIGTINNLVDAASIMVEFTKLGITNIPDIYKLGVALSAASQNDNHLEAFQASLQSQGFSEKDILDRYMDFGKFMFEKMSVYVTRVASVFTSVQQVGPQVIACTDAGLASTKLRLDFFKGPLAPGSFISDVLLRKLVQNIPFSSMEDTTGEVIMSVFKDPANNQQEPNLIDGHSDPRFDKPTAPIKLIIEKAELAR